MPDPAPDPETRPRAGPETGPNAHPDTDPSGVLAAHQAFYAAFNARDLDAMRAIWSAGEDVTCIHPAWNLLRGRAAVLASWQAILDNPGQPRIVSVAETTHAGDDVAVVVGREVVGGSPVTVTNVFRREDGAWRLWHHHGGPVLQAPSGETP